MSLATPEIEPTTLGHLLREARVNQGLDIDLVARETKISPKNLQAIEENDYNSLPADAFARGFYSLYAKRLALDPQEILQRYEKEKQLIAPPESASTPPPTRLALDVGELAERPSSLPFSSFGLVIMVLLLFGAFLCWYFSWNPASFLSQKLRSLETIPEEIEQVYKDFQKPTKEFRDSFLGLVKAEKRSVKVFNLLGTLSPAYASATNGTTFESGQYRVEAMFLEDTEVTVSIDDTPAYPASFLPGTTAIWLVNSKMTLEVPPGKVPELQVNDVQLDMPKFTPSPLLVTIPKNLTEYSSL